MQNKSMKVFKVKFGVRSYECDSYGHVNNAVYLNYLEFARMSALLEKGFTLEKMKTSGFLVVIRRIEIDYISPLYTGQEVLIKTFTSEAKNSSGTFTQQIYEVKNEKLAAEAKVTWVFTNLEGHPIPIPKEIREAFEVH
jgi:YbgC/YbaW family acyl-CoA thioester hydrolase